MKYEIMAHFYEHEFDKEPRFRVPITLVTVSTLAFFRENGFTKEPDSDYGYVDFLKVVDRTELEDWADPTAFSDILCIFENDIDEKHIVLIAYEMDTIGDDGAIPQRSVKMGDTRVYFTTPDPQSNVTFSSHNRNTFIPIHKLKEEFGVITMMEVYDALSKMAEEKDWTYDELIGRFSHLIGDDKKLALKFYAGDTHISFTTDDRWAPVIFSREDEEFRIPFRKLCDFTGKESLQDVCLGMMDVYEKSNVTFEQLKDLFEGSIDDAIDVATRLFFDEKDLDGNPAILHALAVGLAGKTKYEKITGFLHDVIEDTDWTMKDIIRFGFSKEIQDALALLTHDKEKMSYGDYILNIIHSDNTIAINVKLADLRHNIERGKSGGHNASVEKHEKALSFMEDYLKLQQVQ